MLNRQKNGSKTGFSLVEATIALSIMAVVLLMGVSFVTSAKRSAKTCSDRAFAVQKGISLLEEVRNFTQQVGDFAELDALEDGVVYNPFLTIQNVPTPDHVSSENSTSSLSQSGWHYNRQLAVRAFARDVWNVPLNLRDLRIVSARVYRDESVGNPTLLADVGTVLRAPGDQAYPTTQIYDVYLLSIENIPGWWVYMSYIKPLMEVTVDDLQARNPGLNFRAHWINRSSYGRDFRYAPYMNEKVDSYHDIDWVYFYPGMMPSGSAAAEYYVPGQLTARTKRHDDVAANTFEFKNRYHVDDNPLPYALADEYNHSMRYIDELRYFKLRCEAGQEDPMTPTWRILLEKMCTEPNAFENAILVNLHGELLPMPAMRNYSDPARNPWDVNSRGMRVVSHPRYIRTPSGEDLQLRVYAYKDLTDEELVVGDDTMDLTTVVIKGVDLTWNVNQRSAPGSPATLIIERVFGGVDGSYNDSWVDGMPDEYGVDGWAVDPLEPVTPPAAPPTSEKMWADANSWDVDGDGINDTVIFLYNTPMICPRIVSGRGLDTNWRLYGLDYIPSSTEAAGDYSRNLTNTAYYPKNTARWIITVPQAMRAAADVQNELTTPHDGVTEVVNRLTVETRIGMDFETGIQWFPGSLPSPVPDFLETSYAHPPENISRTYAWWTNNTDDVPYTERSQFIGDPRHCPYADLKDAAPVLSFRNHYNWWFDNFKDATANVFGSWQGYSNTRIENDESNDADGWSDYHWRIDVPRLLEVLRTGLINTNSVYTTLTGFSYFYMGIGNEIGYDSANGFAQGIPVSRKPFYGTSGNRTEQVMVPWGNPADSGTIGNGMKIVMRDVPAYGSGQPYWWGKHWIGDLYPDSDFDNGDGTGWRFDGNLPTGNTANTCIRLRRENINRDLPMGTTFTYSRRCMREEGCNSFFMVGDRSNTFYHNYNTNNGALTSAGDEIAAEYAFPLPTSASINRPFRHDWGGSASWKSNPDFDFTSDFSHNSASKIRVFYDHPWSAPNGMGSALLGITNAANTNSSFQVINGLSQTIESGSAFIAKWALLSLVHGFLTAGEPDTATKAAVRIEQLPRVEIMQPTIISDLSDPITITVQWGSDFARWDGQGYTQYYPVGFSEAAWITHLNYVLMYSPDNGTTWFYMEDDPSAIPQQATPGVMPTGADAAYLMLDMDNMGDEFFTWAVPTAIFPEGSYLIRAECYRDNKALHYSYHMEKIFIDR